jgi:Tfp pilus assembly protein PilF
VNSDTKFRNFCIVTGLSDCFSILIFVGAVFEVLSCVETEKDPTDSNDRSKIFVFKMKASDKGSEIAREYIEYQKQCVNQSEPSLMFGYLLANMGQYEKSKQYFEQILQKSPNDEKTACIYSNLARIYRLNGQYTRAIEYYQLAYSMHTNVQPRRYLSAARALNGLGIVYNEQHEYKAALDKLVLASQMYKKYGREDRDYAGILSNMASVYFSRDEHVLARKYFGKVNRINNDSLPSDHPNRASILINMGNVSYKEKDYQKSIDYYLQGLCIKEKVLPSQHGDKISCLNNIGLAYYQMRDYEKAGEYFQKALIIAKKPPLLQANPYLLHQIGSHIQRVGEKIDVNEKSKNSSSDGV